MRAVRIGPFPMHTKYMKETGYIEVMRYPADGSVALRLIGIDGEALAVATVCMTDYGFKPEPGEVFIKNWSENQGMTEMLVANGLVDPPHKKLTAGYAVDGVHVCKVTPHLTNLCAKEEFDVTV